MSLLRPGRTSGTTTPPPPRRPPRRLLALVGALVAGLLAVGCIGYEERVSFDPTGGGDYEVRFGFDMSALRSFGAEDSDEVRELTTVDPELLAEQFGSDVQVEPLSEEVDGRRYDGFRMRATFRSPAGFDFVNQSIAAGEAERDPQRSSLAANLQLDADETAGTYTLRGSLPPLLEGVDTTDPFARLMLSTARRVFQVTLPGRVTQANADERDGPTYTWRLDPMSGNQRDVLVIWEPAGSPSESVAPVPPAETPRPQPTVALGGIFGIAPQRTPTPRATTASGAATITPLATATLAATVSPTPSPLPSPVPAATPR